MSERPMTVIGVMPPRFDFSRLADVRTIMFSAPAQTEFWTPMTITEKQVKETKLNYFVLGRLRDGVTPERASHQFRPSAMEIFRKLETRIPAYSEMVEQAITTLSIYVMPLRNVMSFRIRDSLWMLLGTVGLLLMLVLFNLANLLTRNAGLIGVNMGQFADAEHLPSRADRVLEVTKAQASGRAARHEEALFGCGAAGARPLGPCLPRRTTICRSCTGA
jgi:hypothetical protein